MWHAVKAPIGHKLGTLVFFCSSQASPVCFLTFVHFFLASELARKEQLIGLQQRMKGAEAVRQVITLEPDPPPPPRGVRVTATEA